MRNADNRIHSSHSFDNDIVATFMLALLYLCHESPFLATLVCALWMYPARNFSSNLQVQLNHYRQSDWNLWRIPVSHLHSTEVLLFDTLLGLLARIPFEVLPEFIRSDVNVQRLPGEYREDLLSSYARKEALTLFPLPQH